MSFIEQLQQTLKPDGKQVSFKRATIKDFMNAKWETGVLAGDFGGANIISLYGGYSLNPNISVELWGSQILGNFSNGWMGSVNVVHEAWPEWRVSPFFTLGTGMINTEPKSTIVRGEDRTDQIGHVGAGFRVYVARRFSLRAEYKSYVVCTSRDENKEVEEWKVGIGNESAPPPSAEGPGQVIDPEVERREVREPAIDREDFEVGAFVGVMSIEDFGSDVVYGARLAYHITAGS